MTDHKRALELLSSILQVLKSGQPLTCVLPPYPTPSQTPSLVCFYLLNGFSACVLLPWHQLQFGGNGPTTQAAPSHSDKQLSDRCSGSFHTSGSEKQSAMPHILCRLTQYLCLYSAIGLHLMKQIFNVLFLSAEPPDNMSNSLHNQSS